MLKEGSPSKQDGEKENIREDNGREESVSIADLDKSIADAEYVLNTPTPKKLVLGGSSSGNGDDDKSGDGDDDNDDGSGKRGQWRG